MEAYQLLSSFDKLASPKYVGQRPRWVGGGEVIWPGGKWGNRMSIGNVMAAWGAKLWARKLCKKMRYYANFRRYLFCLATRFRNKYDLISHLSYSRTIETVTAMLSTGNILIKIFCLVLWHSAKKSAWETSLWEIAGENPKNHKLRC